MCIRDRYVHLENVEGIVVHTVCRTEYIKDWNINHFLKKKKAKGQIGTQLLGSRVLFDFKTACLICGERFDIMTEKSINVEKFLKFVL